MSEHANTREQLASSRRDNMLVPVKKLIDSKQKHKQQVLTEENLDITGAKISIHLENHWSVWLKRMVHQSQVQDG
jgi:hypothetical protein